MTGFDRQRAGHQLVVNRLIHLAFAAAGRQADAGHRGMQRHIDFVKGQPQFDLIFIAAEHRPGVALKEANHLPAAPAAIVFYQRPWHFIMRQRHQRGDVVLRHLVEQLVVEREAGFVRLGVVAVGVDAGPGDRDSQAVKAHLGKQGDIFRIAMVKIDRHILNPVVAWYALDHFAEHAVRLYIGGG